MSPANFGQFSNAILVGNFGDGTINAFDAGGNMMGQLTDTSGKALVNPGLWALLFGQTSSDAQTLYFTAGGADQTHGLFATLKAAQAVNSRRLLAGAFLHCCHREPRRGNQHQRQCQCCGRLQQRDHALLLRLTCRRGVRVSPDLITLGTNSATSVLTLSVAQTYNPIGMWLPFSGIGLFGLAFATPEGDMKSRKRLLKRSAIAGAVV